MDKNSQWASLYHTCYIINMIYLIYVYMYMYAHMYLLYSLSLSTHTHTHTHTHIYIYIYNDIYCYLAIELCLILLRPHGL